MEPDGLRGCKLRPQAQLRLLVIVLQLGIICLRPRASWQVDVGARSKASWGNGGITLNKLRSFRLQLARMNPLFLSELRGGQNLVDAQESSNQAHKRLKTGSPDKIPRNDSNPFYNGGIDYSHFDHAWTNDEAQDPDDHDEAVRQLGYQLKMPNDESMQFMDESGNFLKHEDLDDDQIEEYIKKKDVEVAEDFKRKGVDYIRPERNDTETMKNSTRYQPLHLESPHHASQFKYDRDVDLREVAEEMETNSDILQMEREYIEHEKRLGFNITSRSVSESSEQIDMNDEEERLRFLRKPPEEIIGAGKNDEEKGQLHDFFQQCVRENATFVPGLGINDNAKRGLMEMMNTVEKRNLHGPYADDFY
mmetsp:Transcript_17158/g.25742  ORF Transcript_17158/g.25742 Transcript_17158/m.25742 type:complete len:363 (+) Transcript_17158:145-1233(+)